ncbi:MAG TPA: class I SAM-dependent methyltransferase [Acidobacteriaceae bacterium]|nr:class I SAM-dependent methyltransferase [Acidobacteriaceae bacterium]
MTAPLSPAAAAFDAAAPGFDMRFGAWASVAAQRRAVRAALLREFPARGRILELGGGTGEDAAFLAAQGFQLVLTDPSPRMVAIAQNKLAPWGGRTEVAAADDLATFASRHFSAGGKRFDGAFSNFAPLNCVAGLASTAEGLARLLRPGAAAMLVVFGTFCPGEMVTEILLGRPEQAFRRFRRGPVSARLAGREFTVFYHRRAALQRAFAPWFVLEKRIGIGVAVPPSAAEPWISRHPGLLSLMESFDRATGRLLAALGDHVLYLFRRTEAE